MMYSDAFDRSVPCSQYVAKPFSEREKGAAILKPRLATLGFLAALERQLKCELYQPRIARTLDSPEIASVGEVPVRLKELRVIEGVEQFAAELQLDALADRRNFQKRNFPVVDARSAANRPRRISDRSRRHGVFRSEEHTSELQSQFHLVC